MTPHQMGHDPERDAVYLAALTGIIANPQFFGATYQGDPSGAAFFASSVVAEVFGDAKATGEAGPAGDGQYTCGYCDDSTDNEARCHRCGQAGRITASEAPHDQ